MLPSPSTSGQRLAKPVPFTCSRIEGGGEIGREGWSKLVYETVVEIGTVGMAIKRGKTRSRTKKRICGLKG